MSVAIGTLGASIASGVLGNLTETVKNTVTDAVVRNTTNLSTKGFMPDRDVKAYFDKLVATCPEKTIKANFGDKYKKRLESGYIFLVEKGPIGSWARETYGLGDSKQISEKQWYEWLNQYGNEAMRLYMSMYPTPQIPSVLQKYTPQTNTAGQIVESIGYVVGSEPLANIGAAIGAAGSSVGTTGAQIYANYDPASNEGQTLINYLKRLGYAYNGNSFVSGTNEMSWADALRRYGDLALSEAIRKSTIKNALNSETVNRIQLQVSNGISVKSAIRNVLSSLNLTDEEVNYIAQNELPTLSYQSGAVGLSGTNFTNVGFKQNQMTSILVVLALLVGAYFIFKKF